MLSGHVFTRILSLVGDSGLTLFGAHDNNISPARPSSKSQTNLPLTIMTLSQYAHLKHQIVYNVNNSDRHNQIICILKELFRDDINSPRRFEQINTINHLLKVLELRDLLSEHNVGPLKLIAQKLPKSSEWLDKISDYEKSQSAPRDFVNCYVTTISCIIFTCIVAGLITTSIMHLGKASSVAENTTNRGPPAESFINSNPISGIMSKRKKQRVFKTVTDGIGSFWRDLGRNLKIRECVIDDINDSKCTLSAKAVKLLEAYEEIADPQKWFFDLCDALEKTRRKDLAKLLQEIMAMNI